MISKVIDCEEVEDLEYGVAAYIGTTVGSNVKFTCDIGYELVGAEETECLTTGEWSVDVPVCESKLYNNL